MEGLRHLVYALRGICDDRLRCLKIIARLQKPLKVLIVDAVGDMQSAKGTDKGAELEVAAVDEVEADDLTMLHGGVALF